MPIRTILAACLLLCLLGCNQGTYSTFEGYSPDQVWTAMTAVAEAPDYDDWTMSTNDVWIDPDANRIEIFRRLKRHLHRPGSKPIFQSREFRMRVTLDAQDPPVVWFKNRGLQVPAHVWEERDRYMDGRRRAACRRSVMTVNRA